LKDRIWFFLISFNFRLIVSLIQGPLNEKCGFKTYQPSTIFRPASRSNRPTWMSMINTTVGSLNQRVLYNVLRIHQLNNFWCEANSFKICLALSL
jgi:hypothetical protein